MGVDEFYVFNGIIVLFVGFLGFGFNLVVLNYVFVYKSCFYFIEWDLLNLWYGVFVGVIGDFIKFNLLGVGMGGGVWGGMLVLGVMII